jgi:hypothetical protein
MRLCVDSDESVVMKQYFPSIFLPQDETGNDDQSESLKILLLRDLGGTLSSDHKRANGRPWIHPLFAKKEEEEEGEARETGDNGNGRQVTCPSQLASGAPCFLFVNQPHHFNSWTMSCAHRVRLAAVIAGSEVGLPRARALNSFMCDVYKIYDGGLTCSAAFGGCGAVQIPFSPADGVTPFRQYCQSAHGGCD